MIFFELASGKYGTMFSALAAAEELQQSQDHISFTVCFRVAFRFIISITAPIVGKQPLSLRCICCRLKPGKTLGTFHVFSFPPQLLYCAL